MTKDVIFSKLIRNRKLTNLNSYRNMLYKNISNLLLICIISIWLICIISAPAQSKEEIVERTLNLATAIQVATLNNQELLVKREEIEIAEQKRKEALSFNYPKLGLEANYSLFHSTHPSILLSRSGAAYLPDNEDDFYMARVSLSQFIYTGGRIKTTKRQARENLKKVRLEYDIIKNKIAYETTRAFYKVLLITKERDVIKKQVEDMELILARIGKVSKTGYPFERLYLEREDLITRLREKETELRLSKLNLNKVLGIELNTIVMLKGSLDYTPIEVDINKMVAWAFEYRPEVMIRQAEEAIDALSVSLSRAEWMPTLRLDTAYEYGGSVDWDEGIEHWHTTLNLDLPIFAGWARWARVRQKKAERRKRTISKAQIKDSIRYEVRESFERLESLKIRLEESKKNLERAERMWKTILEGSRDYREIIDCVDIHREMQLKYWNIVYDWQIVKAQLEKAVGTAVSAK